MPKGLVRYQHTGDLHFVTFSCHRRQQFLGSAEAWEPFEHSLETMRVRYEFFVTGYVVMPEHVHLLISEPKDVALAKALQAIKLSVAMQRKERPFWQARYFDFNVYMDRKRIESCAICTATRLREVWWPSRGSGFGRVSGIIRLVKLERWRLSRSGRLRIEFVLYRNPTSQKKRDVGHPNDVRQFWATGPDN